MGCALPKENLASDRLLYTYDPVYRLTGVDSSVDANDMGYTYDDVGNRLTQTAGGVTQYYLYGNTGNRLTEVRLGAANGTLLNNFDYDDNGSMTVKRDGAGSPLLTHRYNQQRFITQTISASHGISTFAYDPNAYRIRKQTPTLANNYLLEAEHLDAVYDDANTLQARYLRGSVVDEIISGFERNGSGQLINNSFHHDQVNSVVALTDHNGAVNQTVAYDPFGGEISVSGTSTNALRYTGREQDGETGLYYYRARYYDPETGRFVSEDPLGFQAGINFYAYVDNNPINNNDPTGNCPHCLFGGAVGATVGFLTEGASQLYTGDFNGAKLAGATFGGAVTGAIIAATGGASLLAVGGASAAGGLSSNLTTQTIDNITGVQQGINTGSLIQSTLVSGIAGPIGSKIPVQFPLISSGTNSFSAITKSTVTKLRNGTIQNVSAQTVGKGIVSQMVASSPAQAIGSGLNSSANAFTTSPSIPSWQNISNSGVSYPSKPNLNSFFPYKK